jgi:uncharacterized protein
LISSVFADSVYWIALISRQDALHDRAMEISKGLRDTLIVTSDMVLVEVLNAFAGRGEYARKSATDSVTKICTNLAVCVVPQTRELFEGAHSLIEGELTRSGA